MDGGARFTPESFPRSANGGFGASQEVCDFCNYPYRASRICQALLAPYQPCRAVINVLLPGPCARRFSPPLLDNQYSRCYFLATQIALYLGAYLECNLSPYLAPTGVRSDRGVLCSNTSSAASC